MLRTISLKYAFAIKKIKKIHLYYKIIKKLYINLYTLHLNKKFLLHIV
jgi:hypothetical protein